MEEQGENNIETGQGITRIDYHIITTRKSLNLDALFAKYPVKDISSYSISEFSGGPARPIGRVYVWLLLKLTALYTAKVFMGLVRLIKRK